MTLDSVYVGTAPGNPIYVQGTKYDSAGRVTRRTLGSANPVQTQYTYYPWNTAVHGGKLQQIYTTRGTTPLQNFQYAYDSNSNITTIQDYIVGNPQTQSFGYDNLDRLTSAGAANGTQGNYGPEGYSYDAATGNLATKGSATYNYDAQSAGCVDGALGKAHAAVSAGGNNYCYDKNGNMVRRVIGGVTYTLTYDAENHMTGYSGGGVNATFVYDGDGRRVQATVNGVTTNYAANPLPKIHPLFMATRTNVLLQSLQHLTIPASHPCPQRHLFRFIFRGTIPRQSPPPGPPCLWR